MRVNDDMLDERNFEQEAIRVTDQVFPHTSRRVNHLIDGVEYDAEYEDDWSIHVVEITVSRKKSKVEHDLSKVSRRIEELEKKHSGKKAIRGWLITQYDLTAEQRDYFQRKKKPNIAHETYNQIVSRIIDSKEYLNARSNDRFGSAIDLFTDSFDFTEELFVQTKLKSMSGKKPSLNLNQLKKLIEKKQKKRILLTGDFGSGKSMHMRELFLHFAKSHTRGSTYAFPIALNLRDFAQLESPDEALRRHADRLGIKELGEKLIRAWRADLTMLFIDGFDEMVPRTSARESKKLQDIRRQALLVVRRFVADSPAETPIVLSGRSHFFSTVEEMNQALATNEYWDHYRLEDLATKQEVDVFLAKYKANFTPPDWLPRRPLLLGYLAVMSQQENLSGIGGLSASEGWEVLLKKFCKREVEQIDTLPLVEADLVDMYGELATRARKKPGGLGPISANDIIHAYEHIFGGEPIGIELGQLLRLPGLVGGGQQTLNSVGGSTLKGSGESKVFISEEYVDVCSALYLRKYLQDFSEIRVSSFSGIKNSISPCGAEVLGKTLVEANVGDTALPMINDSDPSNHAQVDLLQSMIWSGIAYKGRPLTILNCEIGSLEVSNLTADLSRVTLRDCYIQKLQLSFIENKDHLPYFDGCAFEEVFYDPTEIPSLEDFFVSSNVIEKQTSREADTLSMQAKMDGEDEQIFFHVLRKVYEQGGAGRVIKALYSGHPTHMRAKVDEMVEKLRSAGLLICSKGGVTEPVWKPVPSRFGEVMEYLRFPKSEYFKEVTE